VWTKLLVRVKADKGRWEGSYPSKGGRGAIVKKGGNSSLLKEKKIGHLPTDWGQEKKLNLEHLVWMAATDAGEGREVRKSEATFAVV